MAVPAVIIELGADGGNPIMRTCAEATSISKGVLVKLADNNTVSAATGVAQVFGGIVAADKVGGDGSTKVACYTTGVFDITADGTLMPEVGNLVVMSGANIVHQATSAHHISGAVVGKAEETADANEVIRVRLLGY